MNFKNHIKSILKVAAFSAPILASNYASAIVVLISGTSNADLESFINSNFSNVTEIRSGDFSNFSSTTTQDALNGTGAFAGNGAADLAIIGRVLSSAAYQNVAAGYNTTTIPVVALTSYVTRSTGNRLGWHSSNAANTGSTAGAETTVTAAGAAIFGGTAGSTFDWHDGDTTSAEARFNGVGSGVGGLGDGTLLASSGGNLLAASWSAGDLSGEGVTFGGDRLLFNLDAQSGTGNLGELSSTGETALISALGTVGLTAIPEPSSFILGSMGLLALLRRRRS